jgi:TfoX/Sxy family transcriptional regulator of competence genes
VSYDEDLDARLSDAVAPFKTVRKKMFGGTCHILRGNMLAGVYKDYLILRIGEDAAAAVLCEPFVRPFDITGRPLRGWVMVESAGAEGDALGRWLALALEYAESLPPK